MTWMTGEPPLAAITRHIISASTPKKATLASGNLRTSESSMRNFHYTLYREDSDYVAQCLDFDVSSFGATEQEAIVNLKEAIELYLEDLPPTERMPHISNVSVGELAIA